MWESITQLLTLPSVQHLVNSHAWFWPLCEMVHYVGMSLIVGIIGVMDLRILGLFKVLPIGSLKPFVPLAIAGFIGNLITGFFFLAGVDGGPSFYTLNLSFQLKLLLLLVAFVNLIIFQVTGLEKQVYAVPAGGDAPWQAKVIAVLSLLCWTFVMVFGRLLMYNDTLLLFLGL
jgi:H+/Cl- antiporter ClcA